MKNSERNVASVRMILCMCVCVCVCKRGREREGKRTLLKNTNSRSNLPEPASACAKF